LKWLATRFQAAAGAYTDETCDHLLKAMMSHDDRFRRAAKRRAVPIYLLNNRYYRRLGGDAILASPNTAYLKNLFLIRGSCMIDATNWG
jgi:hypothetical protein